MDEAIELATEVLALDPQSQAALALRGAAYAERGWAFGEASDLIEALADLDRAIALMQRTPQVSATGVSYIVSRT